MSYFPVRCQHIKVNGKQCGCAALVSGPRGRGALCYFHKRHYDARVQVNAAGVGGQERPPHRKTVDFPVLESIRVSVRKVRRLLAEGKVDAETGGLMLYALRIAKASLRNRAGPKGGPRRLKPSSFLQ